MTFMMSTTQTKITNNIYNNNNSILTMTMLTANLVIVIFINIYFRRSSFETKSCFISLIRQIHRRTGEFLNG